MKWQTVFCDAIKNRKVLEIQYSDGLWRTIEPHTYGMNTAGHYAVSAFRTAKEKHPIAEPDWRMYLESDIQNVRATTETFRGPRPGYSPAPKTFSQVICKL